MKFKYLKHTKTGKIVTVTQDSGYACVVSILELSDEEYDTPYFAPGIVLKAILEGKYASHYAFSFTAELDKAIVDGEIEICEVTL